MTVPVCIFAKPPIVGKVKTRLAKAIGPKAAAELARAMLCDVWTTVRQTPGVRPLIATTERGDFPLDIGEQNIWLQGVGDLGMRLERILRRALATAPAAIALGADSPLLTSQHLADAIECLSTHDAVLAPCTDGGFVLLGLKHCPPGLLANLPWSRPETHTATKAQLHRHGFSVVEIGLLPDVDTLSDVRKLLVELKHQPHLAPTTRTWLNTWSAS